MEKERIRNSLEVTTNIAVLLLSMAALSAFAITLFHSSPNPNILPGLERGRAFGKIEKVDYATSQQTLLLALNTNCSYCRESLPLYQRLLSARSNSKESLHVVALFPNKSEEVIKYLNENKLVVDAVADVNLTAIQLTATPTMVLVDRNGLVNDFWLGKLGDSEANEFLRSLTKGTPENK